MHHASAGRACPSAPLIFEIVRYPHFPYLREDFWYLMSVLEFRVSPMSIKKLLSAYPAGELVAIDTKVLLFLVIATLSYLAAPLACSVLLFAF